MQPYALDTDSYPITITGNTICYNGGTGTWGIYMASATGVTDTSTITNNIITNNVGGIYCPTSIPVSLSYNDVWSNTTQYSPSSLAPYLGMKNEDPLFVSATNNDFHLQGISGCINAGYDDAPGIQPFDIDLESRIAGGAVDLGADEVQ